MLLQKWFAHHVFPGLYWSREVRIQDSLQLKSRSSLRRSTNTRGVVNHVFLIHISSNIFRYAGYSITAVSSCQSTEMLYSRWTSCEGVAKSHRCLPLKSAHKQGLSRENFSFSVWVKFRALIDLQLVKYWTDRTKHCTFALTQRSSVQRCISDGRRMLSALFSKLLSPVARKPRSDRTFMILALNWFLVS